MSPRLRYSSRSSGAYGRAGDGPRARPLPDALESGLISIARGLSTVLRTLPGMSDFVSVPLRRSLVAGFVFFAMVMSLGQALAGDSSSQSGSVGATVTANAPQISNFDMKDTSGSPATIIGTQIVVITTYTFNFQVNAPNGRPHITHAYIQIWHDGGNYESA